MDGTQTRVQLPVKKGPIQFGKTDVVVVSVKAFDTSMVAESYQNTISPQATLVSLQNGLGNIESLGTLPPKNLLAASTSEGALSLGSGSVVHTGVGLTQLGDPEWRTETVEVAHAIKDALVEAKFHTGVSSNMVGVLWTKTIVNGAINPISSLTRLLNGALQENKALLEIARATINEGTSVSRAAKIKLAGEPRKLLGDILKSTAKNKSSMLQDIEKGKRTEINQINGSIIRYGRRLGIQTPVNQVLTDLVLGLERSLILAGRSSPARS